MLRFITWDSSQLKSLHQLSSFIFLKSLPLCNALRFCTRNDMLVWSSCVGGVALYWGNFELLPLRLAHN
jgi:hypothetical protein